ncbi:MAG: hypothetical protein LBO20_06900 [Bifidobacteriaceae bacterium]|nr:hypothetical protein [Bifidobacteriaceae bacterium]
MSETQFRVVYDGPSLVSHTMPIRDLAPSLLALSEAFTEASRAIDPARPAPALNIRATEPGSFDIDLILVAGKEVLDTLGDLFTGEPVAATLNMGGLVVLVVEAIRAIKWMRGPRIAKTQPPEAVAQTPGVTVIVLTDGATLEIPIEVLEIVRSVPFRQQAADFVKPLDSDRVDQVSLIAGEEMVAITADEQSSFAAPTLPESEDLGESTREVWLQVVGIELDHRKWRFTEGEAMITAPITDVAFRTRIDNHDVAFGKGDTLKVRLRTRQTRNRKGNLGAEHEVEEVLDFRPGPRQVPFENM